MLSGTPGCSLDLAVPQLPELGTRVDGPAAVADAPDTGGGDALVDAAAGALFNVFSRKGPAPLGCMKDQHMGAYVVGGGISCSNTGLIRASYPDGKHYMPTDSWDGACVANRPPSTSAATAHLRCIDTAAEPKLFVTPKQAEKLGAACSGNVLVGGGCKCGAGTDNILVSSYPQLSKQTWWCRCTSGKAKNEAFALCVSTAKLPAARVEAFNDGTCNAPHETLLSGGCAGDATDLSRPDAATNQWLCGAGTAWAVCADLIP